MSHATMPADDGSGRKVMIGAIIAVLVILALVIGGVWALAVSPENVTAKVRDIFIIFMAVISIAIGLVLVILVVQMARLINLLQNEIKPILDSTNETVSTLRGTTTFLSENLTEPVIKMNEYLAGLSEFVKILGLTRKRPKK